MRRATPKIRRRGSRSSSAPRMGLCQCRYADSRTRRLWASARPGVDPLRWSGLGLRHQAASMCFLS
jgi:hypothetical protein